METGTNQEGTGGQRRTSYLFLAVGVILLGVAWFWGISDNPPAIVSMLVGLLGVTLGIIYLFAKSGRRTPGSQLLYWAPRALCIVFILFVSMFALDVFDEGRGFWETVLALFMHLIPSFLLIAFLAISWRREWIAGVLFPLFGILYVVMAWGKPFAVWSTLVLMAGPPILLGILFLLNWVYRKELRGS